MKSAILKTRRRLRTGRQAFSNRRTVAADTQPGHIFFQQELKQLLGCNDEWLTQTAAEYRSCPTAWKHLSGLRSPSKKTDGYAKSLDVAEGFAVWALVKHTRPKVIVELGVQYGVSSRLWKEALKAYVPNHELVLCDLEDKRHLINDDECTFLKTDARQVLPELFASGEVGILHNDAHPYDLIHWSVAEAMKHNVPVLTFHDVGRGPRTSFKAASSQLSKEEKLDNTEYSAKYGHWERHVMAEVFDESILTEDTVVTNSHRIQIFDSLFGFGVVIANG
jgi:hypothetical protein